MLVSPSRSGDQSHFLSIPGWFFAQLAAYMKKRILCLRIPCPIPPAQRSALIPFHPPALFHMSLSAALH
jgi:hypothetical protein